MNKSVEGKKLHKPVFRGRFGTRTKRSKSIAKWDKWRVARGIDIKYEKGDGHRPRVGYKTKAELRDLHPKGFPEFVIKSKNDIISFDKKEVKNYVFRFAAKIGNKKKLELVKLAKEKGMHILNPKVFIKKKKEAKAKTETKAVSEKKEIIKDVEKKEDKEKKPESKVI